MHWARGAAKLTGISPRWNRRHSNLPYEPWPLNEQTVKVLGLPLIALTPTAQLIANGREWLWFDLAAAVAIGQGPA